jgi:hypothetical protein
MSNQDNANFKSQRPSQSDAGRNAIVEIKTIPRQEIADAFKTRSYEISKSLQNTNDLSNKLITKAVPMIVYAIANADNKIDNNEIASFLELFQFNTAMQIFRSDILLAFFKYADSRKALADVGSLKYNENSRLQTDVFSELDAIFAQLSQVIVNEDRDRLRDDTLNLCFIIANSSGGFFEFESNISDEEKYASSKIKAIIDRNFGYGQGNEAINLPAYLADRIEKFAYLFQSEFQGNPSILEIAAFTIRDELRSLEARKDGLEWQQASK